MSLQHFTDKDIDSLFYWMIPEYPLDTLTTHVAKEDTFSPSITNTSVIARETQLYLELVGDLSAVTGA